jgi:hypothetical protein
MVSHVPCSISRLGFLAPVARCPDVEINQVQPQRLLALQATQ